MSSYVLNKYSDLSPPFHLTDDDVTPRSIRNHRILRGFSETVSVQYLTSWHELENTSWETEQDLEQYGNVVERYWAGNPKQVGGENAKYRAYRVPMTQRSQARSAGNVYVQLGPSSAATQGAAPTCTHLTSLARVFSLRQLAMGGNLRRWSD